MQALMLLVAVSIAVASIVEVSSLKTPANPAVSVRLDLRDLMQSPEYSKQRDLFILSWKAIMEMDPSDPLSFYQIGGIHGMPAEPYNGISNTTSPFVSSNNSRWMGYCDHSSVTFPTWHRPYLLLLERSISKMALRIAEAYPKSVLDQYRAAARALRLPFWDWAAVNEVPSFLLAEVIKVNVPTNTGRAVILSPARLSSRKTAIKADGVRAVILRNPLFSYKFQKATSPPLNNDTYAYYAKYPFTVRIGDETSRWPTSSNVTNITSFSNLFELHKNQTGPVGGLGKGAGITGDGRTYQRMVIDLMYLKTWECFSNSGSLNENPNCIFLSIESIHNWLHNDIGGVVTTPSGDDRSGSMRNLETAGFDPIFFLHHCNIDRLIAIWQKFHPGVWVTPGISQVGSYMYDKGQPLHVNSPLLPFESTLLKPATSFDIKPANKKGMVQPVRSYLTSKDVLDIEGLGYTYPELSSSSSQTEVYGSLVKKYGPLTTGFRWYLSNTCISKEGPEIGDLSVKIRVNFTSPDGEVHNVPFHASTSLMLDLKELIKTIVSALMNGLKKKKFYVVEVTRFLQAQNISTDVLPVNGSYANGPSTTPFSLSNNTNFITAKDNFKTLCSAHIPGSGPPAILADCSCTPKLMWSYDAPLGSTPSSTYTGAMNDDGSSLTFI